MVKVLAYLGWSSQYRPENNMCPADTGCHEPFQFVTQKCQGQRNCSFPSHLIYNTEILTSPYCQYYTNYLSGSYTCLAGKQSDFY